MENKVDEEILAQGQEIMVYLKEILERPELKVLCVGDAEYYENPTRNIGAALVCELADAGLTDFALEANERCGQLLNDCVASENPDMHHDKLCRTRWYDPHQPPSESHPDYKFFEMLSAVRDKNLRLTFVDETADENGRYNYRDEHMADEIVKLVQSGARKILLWGGYNHHYTRPNKTKFETAAEILRKNLGRDAVFTVFSRLGSFTKCIVATADCPALCGETTQYGANRVSRCEGGPCPGASCVNHSPKESDRQQVILQYWDAVMCLPWEKP